MPATLPRNCKEMGRERGGGAHRHKPADHGTRFEGGSRNRCLVLPCSMQMLHKNAQEVVTGWPNTEGPL